jgi:hypothetical protein
VPEASIPEVPDQREIWLVAAD